MFRRADLGSVTNRLYVVVVVVTMVASVWALFWLLDTRDEEREALLLGAVRFVESYMAESNPQIRVVKLFAPSLHAEAVPNTWTLNAVAKFEDTIGRTTFSQTSSTVENVCSSYNDRECWHAIRIVGAQTTSETPSGATPAIETPAQTGGTQSPAAGPGRSATDPVGSAATVRPASVEARGGSAVTVAPNERPIMAAATESGGRSAGGGNNEEAASSGDLQSQDSLVLELQMRLRDMGFLPGPLDGNLGPRTAAAIMAYQQKHRLKVDGKPSDELLNHVVSRAGDG